MKCNCLAITGIMAIILTTAAASAQELIGLRIAGPSEVVENTVTLYRVFARFDNGREYEVTLSSALEVEPGRYADIDRFGMLRAIDVPGDREETIKAEFKYEQRVAVAELDVLIRNVSIPGMALQFDGVDDRVEVRADLLNNLPLTLEAWFRVDERPEIHHTIVCNDRGGRFGHAILIDDQGRLGIQRHNAWEWSNAVVELGIWHHAAVVFVPGSYVLYLNGDEVLRRSYVQQPPDGLDYFWVGRNPTDPGGPQNRSLKGWVDEVHVWHVERSQRDITCTMNVLLRGDEAGLVGYWRFDEGVGQIVRDLSPLGNDGFLGSNPDPEGDDGDPDWALSEATIGPGECLGVNCDAIRKLKVKCRGGTLTATVTSSLEAGTKLTIDNDGDRQIITMRANGKAKATWTDQTGVHTVQIVECQEYVKAVNGG